MGVAARRQSAPTPRTPLRARTSSWPASATTTICAKSCSERTAYSPASVGAIRRRSHHRVGGDRARIARRGEKSRLRFRRRAGVGRPGGAENGALTVMCGGDAAAFAKAEKIISRHTRAPATCWVHPVGQLAKQGDEICIAGVVQGLAEALHFAQRGRARIRKARCNPSPRAPRSLADGEPLQDHGRRQIRFRLRGGLDAQGSRRSCLNEARAKHGAHLPLTALVDQFYSEVQKMGGRRWDTSS